ncbi:MAG TPA: DUF4349 domain-containing protein [Anaerolineales bacterium]
MKRTLITIALTTVVVLTLVGVALVSITGYSGGVAQRSFGGGYDDSYYLAEPALAPAAAPAEFYSDTGNFELAYDQPASALTTERLVIQNVDMSIVVADPKARMGEIADMAVEMGGYVVSSNLYQSTFGPNNIEVPEGSITIRVPSNQLDAALESIKEDVVEVTYENRYGQDITDQYVDAQSRLKAKQDAEKKLLQIMDTAEKAEDVLAIYLQVQNIQTEIEVLKGQIKYYEESAALSAISIRLVAEETVKPIEIGGWKLQGTANDAVQDLIRFTQGFTQFLIRFVLSYLPALILIAIPSYAVFIGGRALIRRFRKANVNVEVKEEEKK